MLACVCARGRWTSWWRVAHQAEHTGPARSRNRACPLLHGVGACAHDSVCTITFAVCRFAGSRFPDAGLHAAGAPMPVREQARKRLDAAVVESTTLEARLQRHIARVREARRRTELAAARSAAPVSHTA